MIINKIILLIGSVLILGCNVIAEQTVYAIHGLGRSGYSMRGISSMLRENGFKVVNWHYSSRSKKIDEIADILRKEMDTYTESDTILFVTHSMGGIVVRSMLAIKDSIKTYPYFYRVVMLAPPNNGSEQADYFSSIPITNWLMGPSLAMLKTDSNSYVNRLSLPQCEVGIIAGSIGDNKGKSRRIKGDDDGKVSVQSTKITTMKDFLTVPYGHTFIMDKAVVQHNVLHFLRTGTFLKE